MVRCVRAAPTSRSAGAGSVARPGPPLGTLTMASAAFAPSRSNGMTASSRGLTGPPALPANQRRSNRNAGSTSRSNAARARALEPSPAVAQDQRGEFLCGRLRLDLLGLVGQQEPEEAVGRERDHVGPVADARERAAAEHLLRNAALPRAEIDLGGLRRARQVGDAQDGLVLVLPHIDQHRAVGRADEGQRAAAEDLLDLRTAISRFIQLSSDDRLRDCASTLTAS